MSQKDPLQMLRQMTDAEASRRATERDRIRRDFPRLTAVADVMRQTYPEIRLIAGIEAGLEVGKVDEEMRRQMVEWALPPTETEAVRLKRQYDAERFAARVRR